ncbi:MAG: chlorophyll synthase ChlG [Pseudomonadota bacterium]
MSTILYIMPVNHPIGFRVRWAVPRPRDARRRANRRDAEEGTAAEIAAHPGAAGPPSGAPSAPSAPYARSGARRPRALRRLAAQAGWPEAGAVLELLKPVTWFPPMWAFACGAVSSGQLSSVWVLVGGLLLAGPLVCAMSQAANDWYDRDVDAVNEPHRPIPSGRIPGDWGFRIALLWTCAGLALGALLGPWGLGATIVAAALAWAYSAPPFRLKANGWLGAAATGLAYEGLPWITGAALMAGAAPRAEVWAIAGLYALGAHGIMTLNDFKAIEGDRRFGIRSLPVQLGPDRAARVACVVMVLPQLAVIGLLADMGHGWHAAAVALALAVQGAMMPRLLADPAARAPGYNGTGVVPYVLGMMAAALALGAGGGAGA